MRPGDELELTRVDERRDLREVLVLPALGPDAQATLGLRRLAALVLRRGPHRAELSALELRRVHRRALPALLVLVEDPLRSDHPLERAAADHHRAADGDGALQGLAAELLLVLVALLVAVVDPRDRGVAPVDDAHAALGVDVGAVADEHVAAATALGEAHVAEVRVVGVDLADGHLGPARGHAAQALHLRHQRGEVFVARVADEVAQLDHLPVVVGAVDLWHRGQVLHAPLEDLLLLGDDGAEFLVGGGARALGIGGLS
nr:hypothetical protein [Deltaproteobacteria bacterium]